MIPPNISHAWTPYFRVGQVEARPWTDEDARDWINSGFSVRYRDTHLASRTPAVGYVVREPSGTLLYVSPDDFAANYSTSPDEPMALLRTIHKELDGQVFCPLTTGTWARLVSLV